MTVRTALLLLPLVFAIALSAPVSSTKTGNITLNMPLYAYFGSWNLQAEANITITHTVPIIVCVVNAMYGSPNETQYSAEVCTWFKNFTAPAPPHMTSFTVPALMMNYSVGVYFANPSEITKDNKTEATVLVSGEDCPEGSFYWTGEGCVMATPFKGLNGNETIRDTWASKETKFFTLDNPARVPTLTFKLVDSTDNGQPEDWQVYARWNGNPMGTPPADSNGTVTTMLPLPGTWVYAVYRVAEGEASADVSVSGMPCEIGHAGPDCKAIPPAANNVNLTLTSSGQFASFNYWVNITKSQVLWVSVTTFNQSFIPNLYAANGQLPSANGDNAQIKNCNRDYCTTVHSIFYNASAVPAAMAAGFEDWYLTIQSTLQAGNITLGIWFDSDCVTDCTKNNRGQCLPDGTCQCYLDFTGIDCSISEGLGAPYIVLIIIASLVVASAVVGFVAWAYMRRKRNDYETLS